MELIHRLDMWISKTFVDMPASVNILIFVVLIIVAISATRLVNAKFDKYKGE